MSLGQIAIYLAGAGALITGFLAVIFLRDPQDGMAQTTHRLEHLPEVMTDRYVAMTILAVFSVLYGDLNVITVLFFTFAFMAFADAYIYARAGHATMKHILAGLAATVVMVVAALAGPLTGAA